MTALLSWPSITMRMAVHTQKINIHAVSVSFFIFISYGCLLIIYLLCCINNIRYMLFLSPFLSLFLMVAYLFLMFITGHVLRLSSVSKMGLCAQRCECMYITLTPRFCVWAVYDGFVRRNMWMYACNSNLFFLRLSSVRWGFAHF
jgi:hypothetical protein